MWNRLKFEFYKFYDLSIYPYILLQLFFFLEITTGCEQNFGVYIYFKINS